MEIILYLPVRDIVIQMRQRTPARRLVTVRDVWGAKNESDGLFFNPQTKKSFVQEIFPMLYSSSLRQTD